MSFQTRWDDWKPSSSPRVVGAVGEVSGPFCEVDTPEGAQSFADGPQKDPTAPTTLLSPSDELDREWSAALRQVRAAFQEQGVQPSRGTFECAAWLKMELARDWPDGRGIDRETAGEWLKALVNGKAVGRLSDSGRPIVSVSAGKDPF